MNPARVVRAQVRWLTDLPNVGKAVADDLQRLGITQPGDLRGQDAFALYQALCAQQGQRVDPCMLDVLLSLTDFMNGGEARPWWTYTAQRKRDYPEV